MVTRVPEGDDHQRHMCDDCGYVEYLNPRCIVGCLPVWEGQVLLCLRNIEPRRGYWTLPAGFMENGESVEEGSLRECREEAGAEMDLDRLFAVYSTPEVSQVYMIFLGHLKHTDFTPNFETQEARMFAPEDIPWDQLAFRSVEFALRKFVEHGTEKPTSVWTGASQNI